MITLAALAFNTLFAQNPDDAEKMVAEGVVLHDKGEYKDAIKLYDKALKLDQDNLLALAEKAFSLMMLNKYKDAIKVCETAIEKHPESQSIKSVFVTCGNAYDAIKETDKAIETYNKGIELFPSFHQLYYNKGISLSTINRLEEAIICFEKSASLNPMHASSHNAISRLTNTNKSRVPSILANCFFLALEPEGARANENLASLNTKFSANVTKTGENSVSVNINSLMLSDTTKDGKIIENNFGMTDMMLTFSSSLDFEKLNLDMSKAQIFKNKMETICSSLKESQKNNTGFFWKFYAPYFIEMKDKGFIEVYSYIANASSKDEDVTEWIKGNPTKVTEFFNWTSSFKFKTE